jgi:uncharacterized membrane protein YfcA
VIFEYIISGFAVGVLVGLTGVGGGSLMTPLLVLFLNFQLQLLLEQIFYMRLLLNLQELYLTIN